VLVSGLQRPTCRVTRPRDRGPGTQRGTHCLPLGARSHPPLRP